MRIIPALALALAVLAGCSDDGQGIGSDSSPGARLASLDGVATEEDDPEVERYDDLLADLARRCDMTEERIGDLAVTGVELLASQGSDETNESVLLILDEVVQADTISAWITCDEVLATYITLSD